MKTSMAFQVVSRPMLFTKYVENYKINQAKLTEIKLCTVQGSRLKISISLTRCIKNNDLDPLQRLMLPNPKLYTCGLLETISHCFVEMHIQAISFHVYAFIHSFILNIYIPPLQE